MSQEIDRQFLRTQAQHELFLCLRSAAYNCGVSIDDVSEELVRFYAPEEIDFLIRLLREKNAGRPGDDGVLSVS